MITRAYDELSRLLRLVGAATQTTAFGYDNNSNLVSLTDPLNKSTTFGFDALNRLISATNPLMGVRNTGYDPQNNVTSESDERSIATAGKSGSELNFRVRGRRGCNRAASGLATPARAASAPRPRHGPARTRPSTEATRRCAADQTAMIIRRLARGEIRL